MTKKISLLPSKINTGMSNKFYQLTNFPPLPQEIITDGLTEPYEFTVSPYTLSRRAELLYLTDFYKVLTNQFGKVECKYLRNTANSYYDWHVDKNRQSALNWIIKTNPGASTFFRSNNQSKFFWDLEEVIYSIEYPTLLNTKQEHCIVNNYAEERTILSVSILNDHSYKTVLEFLQTIKIDQY